MATEIQATENGPYVIAGSAVFVDADGNERTTPGKAVALCRCGGSANKPFCDGSHKKIDFTAEAITLVLKE